MGGWGELLLAFVVFLLSHALPARPALRERLVGMLGQGGYLAAYTVLSLALLGWLIVAAGRAPYVPLLPWGVWQAWVPNIVMPFAVLLIVFGTAAPNPLSFGGAGNGCFDPERPGIVGVTRHPLPWGLVMWSGSHGLANPDLAHVLLFGGSAGFALLGMWMIDRRNRRRMGVERWAQLGTRSSIIPFAALLGGRWRPAAGPSPLRLVIALLLWISLLGLHGLVIGVSPFPVPS